VRPAESSESIPDLVASARAGDGRAFGRLYQLFGRMVHGVLLARAPAHEVDDLVQEVFLKALRQLDSLRDARAFGAWIAMIARHAAIDRARRRPILVELSDDLAAPESHDDEARRVLRWIRELPEAYRETLMLRLVEGMSGPEIAERTGLKAGSVRVNLHRGIAMLRERLAGEGR
jgi:RNA polymerase sigma-70 factor (ECF subfamily)